MADRKLPSPARLHQLISYNADSGILTWRARQPSDFSDTKRDPEWVSKIWNANYAGNIALGARHSAGYLGGTIEGAKVFSHRVAVAIAHMQWPDGQVDHINGKRDDNRFINLRVVTQSENNRNSAIQKNNTSGHVGVCFNMEKNRWWAYVHDDLGKRVLLGAFKQKEDAIIARKAAENEYGYHENHGRHSGCYY